MSGKAVVRYSRTRSCHPKPSQSPHLDSDRQSTPQHEDRRHATPTEAALSQVAKLGSSSEPGRWDAKEGKEGRMHDAGCGDQAGSDPTGRELTTSASRICLFFWSCC